MSYSGPINEAPPPRANMRYAQTVKAGASFGSALAITISWSVNHSILWACIHGILSWFYVAYFAITR